MCKFEDELVDNSIDADSATYEFHICVIRIAKDEILAIEFSKLRSPDATGDLS
jgi:hypothetical protein